MSTISKAIIFTHAELLLRRNVGVALVMDQLKACGAKDDGKDVTIPLECFELVMKKRWAPELLEKKQAAAPRDGKSRMQRDGPRLWAELHTMARTVCLDTPAHVKTAKQRFQIWSGLISCGECAADWEKLLKEHPPDFSSQEAYFAWTHARHNDVNIKLGKPILSREEADRLYPAPPARIAPQPTQGAARWPTPTRLIPPPITPPADPSP